MEKIGSEVSLEYLKLGIAGAALLIVLIFVIMLFTFVKFNSKQLTKIIGENTNDKVDKLCDKIDSLVTVTNNFLTTNGKDLRLIIEILNQNLTVVLDTQRRVVRIDDRTFSCRGNPPREVLEDLHKKKDFEAAGETAAVKEEIEC
jgi:uncharacterized membrane protein YvbJ